MRRRKWLAFLAVLCITPTVAHAQGRKAERKIAIVLAEFNEEMRGYERELKYFDRVAEFRPLFALRTQLVEQAAAMNQLDTAGRGSGPAILALAREMDRTARKLDADTGILEKRADAVSNGEGRIVAGRMKTHANTMVKMTDELIGMFR